MVNLREMKAIAAPALMDHILRKYQRIAERIALSRNFQKGRMQTVGVMGDFRTYDYAIALRAVITSDFMTATAAEIPWDVLQRVMTRIVNEVDHVNRVFYDLTSKPPGVVEFE